jgi:hypothetical protein
MAMFYGTKKATKLAVSVAGAGDNTIVAAAASPTEGKGYRVISCSLWASGGANNIKFKSGGATDITGVFNLGANGFVTLPEAESGWCETGPGAALVLNLSAATAVSGIVVYVEV